MTLLNILPILIGIIIFIIIFFVIRPFFEKKQLEKKLKKKVYSYISQGQTLREVLRTVTVDVLARETRWGRSGGLGTSKLADKIADEMDKLQAKMSVDNILEIYSEFIDLYILKKKNELEPQDLLNLSKVLDNMEFYEKDGYFFLKYKPPKA